MRSSFAQAGCVPAVLCNATQQCGAGRNQTQPLEGGTGSSLQPEWRENADFVRLVQQATSRRMRRWSFATEGSLFSAGVRHTEARAGHRRGRADAAADTRSPAAATRRQAAAIVGACQWQATSATVRCASSGSCGQAQAVWAWHRRRPEQISRGVEAARGGIVITVGAECRAMEAPAYRGGHRIRHGVAPANAWRSC